MSKPKTLEKYRTALFEENGTKGMSVSEANKIERFRNIYAVWLNNPAISRATLRDYIKNTYPTLSDSQIYRDINDIHILLGSVQNASRAHIQFVVNETLLSTITTLQGDNKRSKELIMAVNTLAKYNQLDKDAPEPVNWSEMVDFEIEPTSDPSELGIEPMKDLDAQKAKLYKRYAEDTAFENIKELDDADKA